MWNEKEGKNTSNFARMELNCKFIGLIQFSFRQNKHGSGWASLIHINSMRAGLQEQQRELIENVITFVAFWAQVYFLQALCTPGVTRAAGRDEMNQ